MNMEHTIEVLDPSVVEKIAAGEVIERPASVLKELIENSIDATSTKIDITIEDAGFSLIRIIDNGIGMSPRNLEKCLLRHATSKITRADDLFSIGTMGFRGEALAAISAVARVSIASSADNSGMGYQIISNGGVAQPISPVEHPKGTTIIVRDLFFNVPARKKFMKTRKGEQMAILRMMEQLVVPFPSIHFTVTIDGKRALETSSVESLRERIADVAGIDFAKGLIECRGEQDGMDVLAYVSTPEQLKERPRFQSLYVNLRRIDNDSVTFSIREAFSKFLGASYRPSFFCFLDIDPSRIDVNVHPTKQQVKFDDERMLFGFIFSAVKRGLGESMAKPEHLSHSQEQPISNEPAEQDITISLFSSNQTETKKAPLGIDYSAIFKTAEQPRTAASTESAAPLHVFRPETPDEPEEKRIDSRKESALQLSHEMHEQIWDLISCYQIHGLFILAPIKNGILLIDQHAAHERVLFEQALEDLKRGRSASQQLLFPIVMELTPTEKAVVESGIGYFSAFGFEVADFGGRSLSVSAIPAFIRDSAVVDTIREMIRYLLDGKNPESFLEPEKRFAAAFACGAAIKAGQKLSQEEMNALLNSLFSAKNPYTCPHGRPTLVRISLEELSRRFLR
ncbi:MAG TPA: DNA mismatch repair endonuclease MutL [Chitinispirillaceae bacterium]|nr:DNA mismatch repair endonuclease MutL [Chitinispirillaceae bacterium]